eukprot:c14293_g1_i1.p1 GENE.c14293_g1_i1~~c14293_g1_i1.p1  ORF type:complete len:464 (+),score=67.95 c14293_g1_i1:36-1427(+)
MNQVCAWLEASLRVASEGPEDTWQDIDVPEETQGVLRREAPCLCALILSYNTNVYMVRCLGASEQAKAIEGLPLRKNALLREIGRLNGEPVEAPVRSPQPSLAILYNLALCIATAYSHQDESRIATKLAQTCYNAICQTSSALDCCMDAIAYCNQSGLDIIVARKLFEAIANAPSSTLDIHPTTRLNLTNSVALAFGNGSHSELPPLVAAPLPVMIPWEPTTKVVNRPIPTKTRTLPRFFIRTPKLGTQEQKLMEALAPYNPHVAYLTQDLSSWVIHCRGLRLYDQEMFDYVWSLRPSEVLETITPAGSFLMNRLTRTYGQSYFYAGQMHNSGDLDELPGLVEAITKINSITRDAKLPYTYKMCVVNWYEPNHSIAAHSDDESQIQANSPIFSLSYGETRTFILAPNADQLPKQALELHVELENEDMVIMGGRCQSTHVHGVPKEQNKRDGRINLTFRAFKQQ